MANLIAAKLGAAIELVPVTSANRIAYLQTKKAELVISTLGKSAEREKVIDFTSAYSPFFQAVFAAKGVSIKSAADLAGRHGVGLRLGAGAGAGHGCLGSGQHDGAQPGACHRIQVRAEGLT